MTTRNLIVTMTMAMTIVLSGQLSAARAQEPDRRSIFTWGVSFQNGAENRWSSYSMKSGFTLGARVTGWFHFLFAPGVIAGSGDRSAWGGLDFRMLFRTFIVGRLYLEGGGGLGLLWNLPRDAMTR